MWCCCVTGLASEPSSLQALKAALTARDAFAEELACTLQEVQQIKLPSEHTAVAATQHNVAEAVAAFARLSSGSDALPEAENAAAPNPSTPKAADGSGSDANTAAVEPHTSHATEECSAPQTAAVETANTSSPDVSATLKVDPNTQAALQHNTYSSSVSSVPAEASEQLSCSPLSPKIVEPGALNVAHLPDEAGIADCVLPHQNENPSKQGLEEDHHYFELKVTAEQRPGAASDVRVSGARSLPAGDQQAAHTAVNENAAAAVAARLASEQAAVKTAEQELLAEHAALQQLLQQQVCI